MSKCGSSSFADAHGLGVAECKQKLRTAYRQDLTGTTHVTGIPKSALEGSRLSQLLSRNYPYGASGAEDEAGGQGTSAA